MFKRAFLPFLISALFAQTALCVPPVVKTVPWVASNPLIPHDTYSGKQVTLKGTSDMAGTYTWKFGDGTADATGTLGANNIIEAKHAYSGAVGLVYTATLTVKNSANETSSKNYVIKIQEKTLAVEANIAIDEGLWYLFKAPTRLGSGGGWRWVNNGGSGYDGYYINTTASAVQAFEVNGHFESGQPDNPYSDAVKGGIDYLMSTLSLYPIGTKSGGVVSDSNGNGYALSCSGNRQIYEQGAFMDALVASGTPNATARTGVATYVLDRTYKDIVQDMVDMYAYGQYDSAGNGSWEYSWGAGSDNSASQWAAIGMIAAERHFGCTVPQWVKDRNKNWLNSSYNSAGYFGYRGTGANGGAEFSTGGCGMVQLAFDGFDTTDLRWVACQKYFANNWNTFITFHNTAYYYACYAFTKAMRVALPASVKTIKTTSGTEIDWYGDNANGLARNLVKRQNADGSWPFDNWPYVGTQTASAWCCIMLSSSLFQSAPVAVAKANPNPAGGGQLIQLDGASSYHPDTARTIVSYEWDLDNDGTFEKSGPFQTVSFLSAGSYIVTLRVTDDNVPALNAQTSVTIILNLPPLAPTANAGGPYSFCPGVKWFLDGTKSTNPDEGLHEGSYPGDTIIKYEWDLSGSGTFTDASGPQPDVSAYFATKGPGTYMVQLRVTDQTATSFPSKGQPNLTSTATATVVVHPAGDTACQCVTDLNSASKSGQVQLTWDSSGDDHYNIYRGTTPGGPYSKIGSATIATATASYLDNKVVNGTVYYYVVRAANNLDREMCQSTEATGTPVDTATIDHQPLATTANAGTSASLSIDASGPTPLSYQWYHDGNIMPLAKDPILNFPSLKVADQGDYRVDITNPGGVVSSSSVRLTVLACDLQPSAPGVTVVGQLLPGGSLQVAYDVNNIGTADATGTWRETIVLTDGTTIIALQQGSFTVSDTIAPGAKVSRNRTVIIPDTGVEGIFHIAVTVDADNDLVESDESNILQPGDPIIASSSNMPGGEGVAHAIDGTHAKYLNFDGAYKPCGFVVTPSIGASTITGIFMESANDAPERDPLSITIEGSNDDSVINFTDGTWSMIYKNSAIPAFANRYEAQIFYFPNATSYKHYRWTVLKTQIANPCCMQIAEVQMLGSGATKNNRSVSPAEINIPKVLTLQLAASSPLETDPAFQGTVKRSGSVAGPLTASLSCDDASHLTVPASVIIPAGSSSAAFNVTPVHDNLVKPDVVETITASASGYSSASAKTTVRNVDLPALTLAFAPNPVVEGGIAVGTVTRADVTDSDLVVFLDNSNPSHVSVPPRVTIPANTASVTFNAEAVENTLLEPTRVFAVTCSEPGHASGTANLSVSDNDLPTLTFTLANTSVRENSGKSATIGRIQRSKVTDQPLQIMLACGDVGSVQIPGSVVISAGQSEVYFQISTIDNNKVDGDRKVSLVAQALDYTGAAIGGVYPQELTVTDDDVPALQVVITQKVLPGKTDAAINATVARNTPAAGDDLVVSLSSSAGGSATVPATVTIPSGQTTVTFQIHGGVTPSERVTITASANGYNPGSDWLMVSNQQLPDFTAESIVLAPPYVTEAFASVSYNVFNRGVASFKGDIAQRLSLFTNLASPFTSAIEVKKVTTHVDDLKPGLYFGVSETIQLPVRAATYWVLVEVDPSGAIAETDESNNAGISAASYPIVPEYSAVVYADVEVSKPSLPVPLHGSATKAGGPAISVPVTIHLTVNGTTREISAITDQNGSFTTLFHPLAGEAGHFYIGASHPGVNTWKTTSEFVILGMKATPAYASPVITEGSSIHGIITLANLSDRALTGLSASAINVPVNLAITFDSYSPTLPASGTLSVGYTIKATAASPAQSLPSIEVTCTEGITTGVPLYVTVNPLRPMLVAYPNSLKAGMLRGKQTLVTFDVANNGAIGSGPINIVLPDVPWMSVAGENPMQSVAPGETNKVTLLLSPDAALTLGHYTGALALNGVGASLSLPYDFVALSNSKGDLIVTVVDEYTYYATGNPKVANATVTLSDAVSQTVVRTATTGTDGIVLFNDLPESFYTLDVQAPQHSGYKATFLLQAGVMNTQEAFLARQTVQYVWTVTPTEIPDRTKITIEAVFETVVPIPVVTVQPSLIDLDTVTGNYMQIDLVVKNTGLVAAKDARLAFPSHPCWELKPVIENIGDIPAESSLTIPVLITRKGMDGCSPCEFDGGLTWTLKCANRVNTYVVPIHVVNAGHDCGGGPVVVGTGGGGGGGGWGGGGGGWSGGGATYSPPNIVATKECDCAARVKIKIDQEAVVARDAFKATLELMNGTTTDLSKIAVNVEIKNRAGEDQSKLFETRLSGVSGMSGVTGEGTLAGSSTGIANWLIMPTVDAAPTEPTQYWVGGTLSYEQSGLTVTIPLDPVTITVLPLPQLSLKYFLQRDVFSDDPFTSIIEPKIPFNLAVMVHNSGAGLAKALQITSAQPTIVENESGLAIKFNIISTEVSGKNMVPSLIADFGDVQPGEIKVGRWLLTSTLQGLFIDYKASFQNLDALGNPKLNIITDVEIHEMNHLVRDMRAGADALPDFLVHDHNTLDPRDLPDTIYLTDGTKALVSVIEQGSASGAPSAGNLVVTLTVPVPTGWSYIRLPDPSLGNYQLVSVKRGGVSLAEDNFWQTDRTFIGQGHRPIREHILHLFDYTSASETSYELTYAPAEVLDNNNHPPVAAGITMSTQKGTPNTMSIAKLLRVCSDPDGDAVSFVSVSNPSAQHGVVEVIGTSIRYTPAAGFVGSDSFMYSVEDSRGASAEGSVAVTITPGNASNTLNPPVLKDGKVYLRFAGIPGINYSIEACDNLTNPVWIKIGASTAGPNGLIEFSCDESGSERYYRTSAP